MSVQSLDHVNIRTPRLDETIAFYRDALGMTVTAPPGAAPGSRAAWITDGAGHPVIHLGTPDAAYPSDDAVPFTAQRGGGSVHHFALNCRDFAGTRSRLQRLGIEISEHHLAALNLRQLFVLDPNGVMVELNFFGD